jgi:phytoene dehydrogenase-like protein
MARVAVVGGGFGGMAVAARLAKLGHEVTLLERSRQLGGALVPVERDGFAWDGGPTSTLLPAVLRDLFRKSGRPAERELELVPLEVLREHRFADGTAVRLPSTRAAQIEAVDGLAPGLGSRWADHVQSYADDWEVLRREYLERPWDRDHLPSPLADRLRSRGTLARRVRRLPDDRLRLMALHPSVAEGHEPRDVPAWVGVTAYVEQKFGAWTVAGGMSVLAEALAIRLATRAVEVHTGTEVRDLVLRDGQVVAVDTAGGQLDADVVVVACDPRRLPALAPYVRRTLPALPPVVVHLGLEGDLPDLAHETVLHGGTEEPTVTVRAVGNAWTLLGRGRIDEDLVTALVRRGIDVRPQVVTRVDRSPRDLVVEWGGSPLGVLWQGPRTVFRRLGPATPLPGVYAAGAHATPGSGLPYVGLSAALVAQVVGPA